MKNKNCNICRLAIEVDNEEYIEVKQYEKKDKLKSTGFYHIKCFRDRLNGTQVQNAVQMKALDILDKIGVRLA
jgi:hypothetical protein